MFRTFVATAVLTALSLPAFAAEKISLQTLNKYFEDLKTAQAGFTQINGDGSISAGTLMIKRPWKMRFEYKGDGTLVLASARSVAIFDPKGDPQPETYPLKRTPLWLILARDVDLTQNNTVIGHEFDGNATTLVAQDPNNPELGTIQMVFTDNPVQLRQWIVTDEVGSATTVVLGAMETGLMIRNSVFDIGAEIQRRQ